MLAQFPYAKTASPEKINKVALLRMSAAELNDLLARVKEADSCGPSLEYDADYYELVRLAGQQFDSQMVPPSPSDWSLVYHHALKLFDRSLDLRCAIVLLRATIRLHGWSQLAPTLRIVQALLEHQWDGVHPTADEDDPEDFIARANVLASLADVSTVLADLRDSTPWGRECFTVRDVLRSTGVTSPDGRDILSVDELRRLLSESVPPEQSIDTLSEVDDAAVKLNRLIGQRFSSPPDLTRLLDITRVLYELCAATRGESTDRLQRISHQERAIAERLSVEQVRGAQARLLEIIGWLDNEGLTDRAPHLIRQSRRLQISNFAKMLAEIVPNAGDPLSSSTGCPGGN